MTEKPLAIISGGNGYVGSAISSALRNVGWNIAILSRSVQTEKETYQCDLTKEREVNSVVENIVERYGAIDACIHAASPGIVNKPLLEMDLESFEISNNVAVRGAFLLAKAVVPHMKAGASFIGITSKLIEPKMILSPMCSYVTAKYGLRGFLRTRAGEVRMKGIRVYAVAPGFLRGGLNDNLPTPVLNLFASKSGAGTATIEEVADLVKILCTVQDAYPTGSSITIPPITAADL